MFFPRFFQRTLLTWFGTGYVPVASGTAGSLATLPLCWLLATQTDIWFRLVFAIGMTAIATLSAIQDQKESATPDPSYVVVDEVAGMLWTTLPVSPELLNGSVWVPLIIGFVVFRALDIIKPFPARHIDRSSKTATTLFGKGSCIILDDVVAGVYSALILHGFIVYFAL